MSEEDADRIILEQDAKGCQRRSLFGITKFTDDRSKPGISEMKDSIKTAPEMKASLKTINVAKASLKREEDEDAKDL